MSYNPAAGVATAHELIGAGTALSSLTCANNTMVQWGSSSAMAVVWDSDSFWNVPSQRFTIPVGYDGKYLIQAECDWNIASSLGMRQMWITQNAVTLAAEVRNGVGVGKSNMTASVVADLVAGNDIYIYSKQSEGSSHSCKFMSCSIHRLRI